MVRRAEATPGGAGREGRGGVVGGGAPAETVHRVVVGPMNRVALSLLLVPLTGHADLLAVAGLGWLSSSPALSSLSLAWGGGGGAGDGLGRGLGRPGPRPPGGREGAGVHHHVLQGQQDVCSVFPMVLSFSRAGKFRMER